VWFNTSSIDGADDEWIKNDTKSYTKEEIKNKSRQHTVTHVSLLDDIPPNINTLFPHLTHLWVDGVDRNADWTRYDIVCNTSSMREENENFLTIVTIHTAS